MAPAAASGGGGGSAGGGSGLFGSLAGPDKILAAALRDPISFLGGVFAGALALDLQQGALGLNGVGQHKRDWPPPPLPLPTLPHRPLRVEPLRGWIEQTAEESGLRYAAAAQRVEAERAARSLNSADFEE